jgi:dihydrodipicolinate synthase/N-acetylneuraminate lyase
MPHKSYSPAILATCCLPWSQDGTLLEEVFRREVRNLLQHLTRDIYLFGTAGEGYAVTDRQFDEIIRIFWEETNHPDTRPMVGVISLSLGTIVERIARARDLGFRHFQISLPGWGALDERELMRFFEIVCGRFPDCLFLHYNLMRTKRLVTAEEYARLADEFPNLVATKNGTDSVERIEQLMGKAPQLLHFFTEAGYGYAAQLGQCGFLISAASLNFAAAREYFEAGQRGQTKDLVAMQGELRALIADLVAVGGSEAHMDGAYDQFYCKAHDPQFPLRLLPPYSSFSQGTFERFLEVVRQKHPRWFPKPSGAGL